MELSVLSKWTRAGTPSHTAKGGEADPARLHGHSAVCLLEHPLRGSLHGAGVTQPYKELMSFSGGVSHTSDTGSPQQALRQALLWLGRVLVKRTPVKPLL